MISFTFATAFGVRVIGAFLTSGVVVDGVTVVAIPFSLRLERLLRIKNYSRPKRAALNDETAKCCRDGHFHNTVNHLDAPRGLLVADDQPAGKMRVRNCERGYNPAHGPFPKTGCGE